MSTRPQAPSSTTPPSKIGVVIVAFVARESPEYQSEPQPIKMRCGYCLETLPAINIFYWRGSMKLGRGLATRCGSCKAILTLDRAWPESILERPKTAEK